MEGDISVTDDECTSYEEFRLPWANKFETVVSVTMSSDVASKTCSDPDVAKQIIHTWATTQDNRPGQGWFFECDGSTWVSKSIVSNYFVFVFL